MALASGERPLSLLQSEGPPSHLKRTSLKPPRSSNDKLMLVASAIAARFLKLCLEVRNRRAIIHYGHRLGQILRL